jgi:hypothetical protein
MAPLAALGTIGDAREPVEARVLRDFVSLRVDYSAVQYRHHLMAIGVKPDLTVFGQ